METPLELLHGQALRVRLEEMARRPLSIKEVEESVRRQRLLKAMDQNDGQLVYPTIICPKCDDAITPVVVGNTVRYECDGVEECFHCGHEKDCEFTADPGLCFAQYPKGCQAYQEAQSGRKCPYQKLCEQYEIELPPLEVMDGVLV